MKYFAFFLLLGSIISCTLDSNQEDKLNKAFNSYKKAYNTDLTLELVAFTHVDVVKFYKAQGDSAFIHHFDQKEEGHIYYGDYFIKDTREKEKYIQRMYTVEQYNDTSELNHTYKIFAVSSDKGNSWFFINEDDYFNKEIPISVRLFKK